MKDSRFIVIMGWMLTKLGLAGNELLVYAFIYGYSQDAMGGYWGALANTAEALNISKRTVSDLLTRLLDKGLLVKKEITLDGVRRCLYSAVVPADAEAQPPAAPAPSAPPKRQPQRFTPPTIDEVQEYCSTRGNKVDTQRFYDFYTANGWVQGRSGKPIKDWRAAVRTWETMTDKYDNGQKTNRKSKEGVIDQRRKDYLAEAAAADAEYLARKTRGFESLGLFDSCQPPGS